jgi:DNA invertase Pin-like site-specific DNA recombinase
MGLKAVIYARYSSDNQREESIEGQLRECQAFAEKNDIVIVGSYIDRAFSARTDNRPDFQKMIKDSENRLFDAIIVWKLDRFARDRYDSAHYKATLKKHGVKVISAMEPISQDATGILLESLLEGMAEYYSAELAEKVKRGMTENILKGLYTGGTLTFGYAISKDKHFEINPLEAPIVLEAFKMYDHGKTIKDITDYINGRGIRSSRGKKISFTFVNRLLHNRRYIGEYRFGEHAMQKDVIPAIVPQDLFDRVQVKFEQNKKAPAHNKVVEEEYLLTTKLYCGHCGVYMAGESGTSHTGKVHRYYKCSYQKRKIGNCKLKNVPKQEVEDFIVSLCFDFLKTEHNINELADFIMDGLAQMPSDIPMLKKQLAEVEKGISNLVDAIQQGILTPTTKERLENLETQREDLKISLTRENIKHKPLTKNDVVHWLTLLSALDQSVYDNRRKMIDLFVSSIYVFDDRFEVNFNHSDEKTEVTLAEVLAAGLAEYIPIPGQSMGSSFQSLTAPN